MLQADPALEDFGCVIFDEFHERNLQSDLGLALASMRRRTCATTCGCSSCRRRSTASTLRASCPAMRRSCDRWGACSKSSRITLRPRCRARCRTLDRVRSSSVRHASSLRALESDPGDVLVFLPGAAEIRRAVDGDLRDGRTIPRCWCCRCTVTSTLPSRIAALRPAPPGKRKVVVATNIAETSLTIDGVRIVVDAGLERRQRFDPELRHEPTRNGRRFRAPPPTSAVAAPDARRPASAIGSGRRARMPHWRRRRRRKSWKPTSRRSRWNSPAGVHRPARRLAWLDPPPAATYAQARELLQRLDALDARGKRHAGPVGSMARLATHPRLAHMIVRAVPLGLARARLRSRGIPHRARPVAHAPRVSAIRTCVIASTYCAVRQRRPGASVDARGCAAGAPLAAGARTQAATARRKRAPPATPSMPRDEAAGLLLAFAYPDRIGLTRGGEAGRYLLSNGRGGVLPGPSALARSEVIVAADDRRGRARSEAASCGTARARPARTHLGYLIEDADEIDVGRTQRSRRRASRDAASARWCSRSNRCVTRRSRAHDRGDAGRHSGARACSACRGRGNSSSGGARVLLLRSQTLDEAGRVNGRTSATRHCWRRSTTWLAPWLEGITRRDRLARVDLRGALHALARLEPAAPARRTCADAPCRTEWFAHRASTTPSGSPALAVRLQEVFGWMESPRIAGGKVPVTLELLSPARRPVQVTRDLASFWTRGYAEVRKELKGRYPKHYWPDDPYAATPRARCDRLVNECNGHTTAMTHGIMRLLTQGECGARPIPRRVGPGVAHAAHRRGLRAVSDRPAERTRTHGGYPATGDAGARIAQTALHYVGVPYRYGGSEPSRGFDCSGLVSYVHGIDGIAVPRTAAAQFAAARPVAAADLRPGDLVFFRLAAGSRQSRTSAFTRAHAASCTRRRPGATSVSRASTMTTIVSTSPARVGITQRWLLARAQRRRRADRRSGGPNKACAWDDRGGAGPRRLFRSVVHPARGLAVADYAPTRQWPMRFGRDRMLAFTTFSVVVQEQHPVAGASELVSLGRVREKCGEVPTVQIGMQHGQAWLAGGIEAVRRNQRQRSGERSLAILPINGQQQRHRRRHCLARCATESRRMPLRQQVTQVGPDRRRAASADARHALQSSITRRNFQCLERVDFQFFVNAFGKAMPEPRHPREKRHGISGAAQTFQLHPLAGANHFEQRRRDASGDARAVIRARRFFGHA